MKAGLPRIRILFKGAPCEECGTEIVKEQQSGRSIYYCPDCQNIEEKTLEE